jgi:PAS domain S-box-containing protein
MESFDLNYYWKSVVDTIQDGVMVVNPEGVVISVNRAFEEITGYEKNEIVGNPARRWAAPPAKSSARRRDATGV